MAVERIGVLGPLQPIDYEVGNGSGHDLVAHLEGVTRCDDVKKGANGVDSAEGKEDDEDRVHGLTDDRRADRAGPQFAPVSDELKTRHGVGVSELAGPERD